MRFTLAFATLALVATPLAAQASDPAVKRGATLRDVKATRIGTIDRVNPDGSVQVIFNSKFVVIPADKLVVTSGTVATSLSKAEVSKLH